MNIFQRLKSRFGDACMARRTFYVCVGSLGMAEQVFEIYPLLEGQLIPSLQQRLLIVEEFVI